MGDLGVRIDRSLLSRRRPPPHSCPMRPRRYVTASARPIQPESRVDLLVHAAAQLPDEVVVRIDGDRHLRRQLRALASAYGIEERTLIEPGSGASAEGAVVDLQTVESMASLLAELEVAGDGPAGTRPNDADLAGLRIGIVTNYPTHYRVPLFNRVGHRLASVGASFRVFFTDPPGERAWMRTEASAFDHEFVPSRRLPLTGKRLPSALRARLRDFQPSLLVVGGFSPLVAGQVARYSSAFHTPFGVWSGEIPIGPTAAGRLRRLHRRLLLRQATFAISYGYLAGEYLRALAPGLPFVYGRNTAPFPPRAARVDRDRVEVLAVSQAIPRKGLDVLVDAFRLLPDLPCRLTVAGGGPELETLRRRACGEDRIAFEGEVPSNRIGQLFQSADVFAFPTREDPFGLVMVEAFAAGLAVVSSTAPGAVGDLAVEGHNCLLVEEHEPAPWAAALQRLVEQPDLRRRLGNAARETVTKRWSLDHAADAMMAGLRLGVRQAAAWGGEVSRHNREHPPRRSAWS